MGAAGEGAVDALGEFIKCQTTCGRMLFEHCDDTVPFRVGGPEGWVSHGDRVTSANFPPT
ncbi:hypothetical protein GCM10010109_02580 [Actinoplanes campanulatus]|nr:hypothetical protein GCM10010109_02580 [Actinoplanes campanulatus]GID34207.1 hypothetical protein Aca09nite_07130 [Actinoplanes campanulatus]